MDVIIKTVSRILFPFVLLIGAYLALHGHLGPGGAFPAGAVIASGFVLLIIAYKESDVEHRFTKHELIDIKSVAGILLVALIISMTHKSRWDILSTQTALNLWSGGFTPFLNIVGGFMVVTALVFIIYTLVRE
jgi:multicomponent Na+:H+ antiporter subunit B